MTRFDRVWIDCLNGDKYKTGKLTPDGKPDPSVFSTEHNREGIQVGTAIALLARHLDVSFEQLMGCLGGSCVDVYLNKHAYWRCVPALVWTYTIGGYQVIKKWLSYRERPMLGRDLTVDEARYVTEMARRIAAILLLEPALDANYECIKADTFAWPGST